MSKQYTQLNLSERKQIEEALKRGESFRSIARLIDRDVSTVSREIRENRHVRAFKSRKGVCRDRNWCKRINVCGECKREGAHCVGCDVIDCRDVCSRYKEQIACDRLLHAPWVCNGCSKNRYGCNRSNRFVYDGSLAQKTSDTRKSESRCGIDMDQMRAEKALMLIKDGLKRGLSPYEVSVAYEDVIGVHRSTIYRWVDKGYGGLTNLDLERKVGFKPRKKNPKLRRTSHSEIRCYDNYLLLSEDVRVGRTEMDCICGQKEDISAALTLYNVPSHVQLALKLCEQNRECVMRALKNLKKVMPSEMFKRWMLVVITDNGTEFEDEEELGRVFGERKRGGKIKPHLYYCDPRQSQQKGSCEKNHSELRQILKKEIVSIDEIDEQDLRVLMSHANSNPRASLGGKTPFEMLEFIYGKTDAQVLMDALGIEKISRDNLVLKPEILNIERKKRGANPIKLQK